MNALTLPEHLLLLALNDDKGAVVQSSTLALSYGLAGAVLMELSLRRRIVIREKTIDEVNLEPTGDAILDEALKALADCEREKSAEYWVARPDALVKDLKHRLLDRLVERGVLQREEHRFLWLIPYDRYPVQNPAVERDLRQHIHNVVLHGGEADEATAMLIPLVHACGLANEVFPGEDPESVAGHLKAFAESSQIARAVSDDVAAATITMVSASIMAAVFPHMELP